MIEAIAKVREAAGVRRTLGGHWSDEKVGSYLNRWLGSGLSLDQIVGAMREMRRDRPDRKISTIAYFDGRMEDIALSPRSPEATSVDPADALAAVVGRELAADFVQHRAELEKPLDIAEARLIAVKLRAMDGPKAALDACIGAGGTVPIENGTFSKTPRRTPRQQAKRRRRTVDDEMEIFKPLSAAACKQTGRAWAMEGLLDAHDRWAGFGLTIRQMIEVLRDAPGGLGRPNDLDREMRKHAAAEVIPF